MYEMTIKLTTGMKKGLTYTTKTDSVWTVGEEIKENSIGPGFIVIAFKKL